MKYSIRQPLTTEQTKQYSGLSNIVAHLLFHRGIGDIESAEKFLRPNYETDTHDPFLLKDAEKAAKRIIHGIKNNERIAVYSDYDADGIPGAVIFDDLFRRIGFKNYSIYIPHRHDEGFGVNADAIEQLAKEGVKLIITVDCGITDVRPMRIAKERGVDVIITDHHEPPPELPSAYAIVDHKQSDCAYPDKNLCGSAVAYKLIQAILKTERFDIKEGMEKWLLDLVGIATLSDMVPLTGENRVFAHYGLAVLRKSPRKGIMQLLRMLNIGQRHLTEDDIAFMITPRINAASRMGVPMDAFRLLAAENDIDANVFATHLDKINNERKGVVASLVKEVKKILESRHSVGGLPSVIVLGNPNWKPSLLGLVANTCAEEYDRPVFLWGRDGDNVVKGSCRSEGRTNVVELMRAAPTGAFSQFGGHKHSGGFSVSNEQIHFLEKNLNEIYQATSYLEARPFGGSSFSPLAAPSLARRGQTLKGIGENLSPQADVGIDPIDMELSIDDISGLLYEDINKLAPFGMGNPKPVFLFRKVKPISVRNFGKADDHIELSFKKTNGEKVNAISFFGATNDWAKAIVVNKPLDLVASIEKSTFRNKVELRLRIVDIILG